MADGSPADSDFFAYQFALAEVEELDDLELLHGAPFSAAPADQRPVFRRAVLSLGTEKSPLLAAAVEGVKGSITSQIAVQMSIRAIVEAATAHVETLPQVRRAEGALATDIIRSAFKEANRQVYEYAHKMRAGGRIAATGFVSVYDGRRFSVARVGGFESYIWRQGAFSPLYEPQQATAQTTPGILQRFIGANSQILVDLASVVVQEGDVLVVTSLPPSEALTRTASEILGSCAGPQDAARRIAQRGFWLQAAVGSGPEYALEKNIFVAVLTVGRPTISLTRVVEES
ncbi:MAG: hypothetical protein KDD69_08120 [Bdellovibrionales bacterium]|nr:hypothetical protein [Bdellovibrionales bacterium]